MYLVGGYGFRGVPAETDGASRRGCCYGKMEKEGADNVVNGAGGGRVEEDGRREGCKAEKFGRTSVPCR